MTKYRTDDIEQLLPTWRAKVRELILRMGELGYVAVLHDGLRTEAEAKANAAKGVGIADSVHCYGLAADLICGLHGWQCHKNRCGFFEVLGREGEALGMVWGGRFSRVDLPHFQAIPVAWQKQLRALGKGADSAAARDALSAKHFASKS